MLAKLKNNIEKELLHFTKNAHTLRMLGVISPLLSSSIKNFILRGGKRIRPILFTVGYLGFAKRVSSRLYTSAISMELLHDFMLVHDDIIDKSDTRRGKPSMHALFNRSLAKTKNAKCSGQDLAIVTGDVMYAMAIDAFLSIKAEATRKEKALKSFVQAAMLTGCGEFIELINGIKAIEAITKQDIYKIYDCKTAYYTFASPLSAGAILAGANQRQIDKLFDYGMCVGRAFQIKDDILGIFGEEQATGKSNISDLQEAKKTILIWHAYHHADKKTKSLITKILSKTKVIKKDLMEMRGIIQKTGALDYAKKEVASLVKKAAAINASSHMKAPYKEFLSRYCKELLRL